MNLAAIEDMNRKFPHAELCFVESGGDNLAATFSPELADLTIYVIDVAEGEKIPRKGGPGITRSDLLVINKIDLAPLVGANLAVMEADALRMRVKRPFVFTNLKSGEGVDQIAKFVIEKGGLAKAAASSRDLSMENLYFFTVRYLDQVGRSINGDYLTRLFRSTQRGRCKATTRAVPNY